MPNMIDYISWRGDLTFSAAPFCDVDNLILSYISYVNLDKIAPEPFHGCITLGEAAKKFFEMHTAEDLKTDHSFIADARYVLEAAGASARFQKIGISDYVNNVNPEKELQFAAMQFIMQDGTSYIAFRGTDDTITGWKEDFNLSNGLVPAQIAALQYLNDAAGNSCRCIFVGGHSKGGNLAVYAAAECCRAVQRRILRIYDNDGPGFDKEFFERDGFVKIKPLIKRVVPECSIIGMLLHHAVEPEIIASAQKGVLQHNGLSWQVQGPSFIHREKLDKRADVFNHTLRDWIYDMDKKERDNVINDLFSMIESTGAKTLTQLDEGGFKNLSIMLKEAEKLDPNTKKIVEKLIKSLLGRITEMLVVI